VLVGQIMEATGAGRYATAQHLLVNELPDAIDDEADAIMEDIQLNAARVAEVADMIEGERRQRAFWVFGLDGISVALAIVLAMLALAVPAQIQRHGLYAVDRPVASSVAAGLRLLCTVAAVYPLTAWKGAAGAAAAMLLGYVVDCAYKAFVMSPYLLKGARHLWGARQAIGALLAYVAGFGAARGVDGLSSSLAIVPLALAVGTVVYIGVYLMVAGMNDRDRLRLATGIERLTPRLPAILRGRRLLGTAQT
jgi:hypothetical protein